MASLALGIVGGLIGGPIGFLAGSLIGNLLFPQKVDGPRLSDLHLHTSSYGGMTPILYGTMRVAGNVDWETDLTEHKSTSGGKGGPEVTTYTYSASFGVTLCEGPIAGVRKIWANGRKIYDRSDPVPNQGDLPFTVYTGAEDQLPDPTMEAHLGVGNVPAYRGLGRVVFTDWMLTDYSNTIPSLNFEVYTLGGDIPRRISTFTTQPEDSTHGPYATTYDGGVITVGEWFPLNRDSYVERQWKLDGTLVSYTPEAPIVGSHFNPSGVVVANLNVASTTDGHGNNFWAYRGVTVRSILVGAPFSRAAYQVDPATGIGYVYTVNGISDQVIRYPCDAGIPGASYDRAVNTGFSSDAIKFGTSDNGKLYIGAGATIKEYDAALNLQHTWLPTDFPAGFATSALFNGNFVRYRNLFVFSYAGLGFDLLNLIAIGADDTLSLYPQTRDLGSFPTYVFIRGDIVTLAGGLIMGKDGVTSLDDVPGLVKLSDIVADLSARAGLSPSQYDTSGLPDLVRGYLVSQQQAVRADIDPLRQAFFFDGSEVDDKVVFVKRGGKSVVEIPDDELAAHKHGDTPPPLLVTERAPEVDLPALVSVNYVNQEADYETGTQQAQRQTTQSQSSVTIDLPISLANEEAKAIALKHVESAWLERDAHSIFLPRKYAKYVPTDVITAHGRELHVRSKTETAAGVIKLDAVPSLAGIFLQAPKSVGGGGFITTTPAGSGGSGSGPSSSVATVAALLDLPLIDDGDDPDGFYAAMTGAAGWPGAALYKSSDGGASYASIFSEPTGQILGTVTDALGDFLGGNVFDEASSATVALVAGELTSATELAVLNGANEAVIGAEVVQFKNATLIGPKVYTLTGFLRGRRGTEWAVSSHAAGERFVLLPVPRIASPTSELSLVRKFKPVTIGATVASATAEDFANNGAALKPYAPVLLGGGCNAAGDVILQWTRRTRIGGAWLPFVDVPLSESSEVYVVEIWDSTYTLCAHVSLVGSTSTSYGAADQVSDFGALQQTIYFTVGQLGSFGLGTRARGTAVGAGSSNNDPLFPVPPYGT